MKFDGLDEQVASSLKRDPDRLKRYADNPVNPDYFGKVVIHKSNSIYLECERNRLREFWLNLSQWIDSATAECDGPMFHAGWVLSCAIWETVNGLDSYRIVNCKRLSRWRGEFHISEAHVNASRDRLVGRWSL